MDAHPNGTVYELTSNSSIYDMESERVVKHLDGCSIGKHARWSASFDPITSIFHIFNSMLLSSSLPLQQFLYPFFYRQGKTLHCARRHLRHLPRIYCHCWRHRGCFLRSFCRPPPRRPLVSFSLYYSFCLPSPSLISSTHVGTLSITSLTPSVLST